MKFVTYAGVDLLAGDLAADAVMKYALALALRRLSDVVRLPIIDFDGSTTIAAVLLGPSIPLLSREAPADELEPDIDPLVADIESRTRALTNGGRPDLAF
ncbi:hypothetical protein [Curtobacterium ammoniigenes]|uniref:hypothetical protein n=1 Tax=Curtobacterium ammoniigenes TaxID=395387 RepID=UPI00082B66B5|nr:hypothetical protein [Curtobacterium ammoniigenes]